MKSPPLALGVNSGRLKLLLFVVGVGAATAMVGAIGAFDETGLLPSNNFSLLEFTAFIIFIVVIGGIGSFEGPIIGTILFFIADKILTNLVGEYFIVLGLIGIFIMLFAPRGVWGFIQDHTNLALFPVRRTVVVKGIEMAKFVSLSDVLLLPMYAMGPVWRWRGLRT